jgi:8-oxo-dGTP pyrophosphatase MutT (NUDIX family)
LEQTDPRLDISTQLRPCDAVASVIVVDGCYLMQLRDSKRGIFFPGHWGCFGGGVDANESDQDAMLRELDEELGLRPAPESVRFFSRFDFDLAFAGLASIRRVFYEIDATAADISRVKLGEGSAMRLFSADEILVGRLPITPYDAFALWLHINRRRLVVR